MPTRMHRAPPRKMASKPRNKQDSSHVSVFFLWLCCTTIVNGQTNGAIILSRFNVTSTAFSAGIVRIYYNGWGNICKDVYFNSNAAGVICNQLGYDGAQVYYDSSQPSSYGMDYLPTKWQGLSCKSRAYLSVSQCLYTTTIDSGCRNDTRDVIVQCYATRIWNSPFPGMVRLKGGDYSTEGRIEVYCNGQWGTICSSGFGANDANTICKQLGYDSHISYTAAPRTNASEPVWSDNMYSVTGDACFGTTNACPPHSVSNCSNDVILTCGETSLSIRYLSYKFACQSIMAYNKLQGTIILFRNNVSSPLFNHGIVRVYQDQWGDICHDYSFGNNESQVVCHQLGYTGASSHTRSGLVNYGTDPLRAVWASVSCSRSDYLALSQCTFSESITVPCIDDSYDAIVNCYATRIWDSNPFPGMIRLLDGNYSSMGRIEVYCNGEWGTVCVDGFDKRAARTICSQLGYNGYNRYYLTVHPADPNQPIWSSNFQQRGSYYSDRCYGTANLCPLSSVSSCSHAMDVAIECMYDFYTSYQITTLETCSDLIKPLNVSKGTIILTRNNVESPTYYSGVVRVYDNGWGNICNDDSYGQAEADVICHQLGYTGASRYSNSGVASYGTDPLSVKWDELNCVNSDYLSIAQCTYSTDIDSNCNSNSVDATVTCYSTRWWDSNPFDGMVRIVAGYYSNGGRVEVYCNGKWGTVCKEGFYTLDANTICKQLGYDSSYKHNSLYIARNDSQPMWSVYMYSGLNDTCFGTNSRCPSQSLNNHCDLTYASIATLSCGDVSNSIRRSATLYKCSGLADRRSTTSLAVTSSNRPVKPVTTQVPPVATAGSTSSTSHSILSSVAVVGFIAAGSIAILLVLVVGIAICVVLIFRRKVFGNNRLATVRYTTGDIVSTNEEPAYTSTIPQHQYTVLPYYTPQRDAVSLEQQHGNPEGLNSAQQDPTAEKQCTTLNVDDSMILDVSEEQDLLPKS